MGTVNLQRMVVLDFLFIQNEQSSGWNNAILRNNPIRPPIHLSYIGPDKHGKNFRSGRRKYVASGDNIA